MNKSVYDYEDFQNDVSKQIEKDYGFLEYNPERCNMPYGESLIRKLLRIEAFVRIAQRKYWGG